jgi:hypothetical protein
MALVREAQEILGTTQTTETIHRALWELVSRRRRQLALGYDFSNLPLEEIREDWTTGESDQREPA